MWVVLLSAGLQMFGHCKGLENMQSILKFDYAVSDASVERKETCIGMSGLENRFPWLKLLQSVESDIRTIEF